MSPAGTEQPVVIGAGGFALTDIAVLDQRALPPVWLEDPDAERSGPRAAGAGALHIESVYDFDGTARGRHRNVARSRWSRLPPIVLRGSCGS